ncbi:MAG: hypothetical protein V4517_10640 [Pseudomonadota bacterium]
MMTVIAILTGAVLSTRYTVLCLVPVILAGTTALAAVDRFNEVPLGSTALTALALAVGLQIGYVVGLIFRSMLTETHAGNFSEPERLRDRPARNF